MAIEYRVTKYGMHWSESDPQGKNNPNDCRGGYIIIAFPDGLIALIR